jgi:hypothetical protein
VSEGGVPTLLLPRSLGSISLGKHAVVRISIRPVDIRHSAISSRILATEKRTCPIGDWLGRGTELA